MDAGCGDGLLTVEDLADALREAFLTTDAHFMRSSSSQAGSTAVVALVTRTYVIVANAGDSRCVLWREGTLIATLMTCLACKCSPWRDGDSRCVLWREGRVLPLSVDHKPDRPDELQRIKDAVRAG
jgi:serine/threonine protein phosphatase PrpC